MRDITGGAVERVDVAMEACRAFAIDVTMIILILVILVHQELLIMVVVHVVSAHMSVGIVRLQTIHVAYIRLTYHRHVLACMYMCITVHGVRVHIIDTVLLLMALKAVIVKVHLH